MNKFNFLLKRNLYLSFASKAKAFVKPDENVISDINNNVLKPKHHPGIMRRKIISIPDEFVQAVIKASESYSMKNLVSDGEKLCRHLLGRIPAVEREEVKQTKEQLTERVMIQLKDVTVNTEAEDERFRQIVKGRVEKLMKMKLYNWKSLRYNEYNSLLYLVGRSAAEYAVIYKVFDEINKRDANFKPKSFFDFGSGVGTASWAAKCFWKDDIFEFFNVDCSREMNDLAEILIKGGSGTGKKSSSTFYRQFLPANNVTYDIVISAYSMMELPTLETRMKTILNLWNKTEKYLIIIEHGTNGGFKVVNEIREFLLQQKTKCNGHVFSPCCHDNICPKFLQNDGTPCNFQVRYFSMPLLSPSESKTELYSYVVLKKGNKPAEDPEWPRIIRPTLVRAKHSICRLCTKEGKLDEVVFTASKYGKNCYHCARSSKWGDLLPVSLNQNENTKLQQVK